MTDQDFADTFEASVIQCEGPQLNGHACARHLLSRAVRDAGFKVVLGGEGGDELFAGYGFVRAALPAFPAAPDAGRAGEQAQEQEQRQASVGVSAAAVHDERPQAVHDALFRTSPAFGYAAKVSPATCH